MKALILAAVLLLTLSCGEALKCNNCVPSVLGGRCINKVETCTITQNACGNVMFLPPMKVSYFKRCMKMTECLMLGGIQNVNARCCSSDLCN